METQRELDSMTVPELRAFLVRHDVSPANIPRSDNQPGVPRKADLYARALAVRNDWSAAAAAAAAGPPPAPPPAAASYPLAPATVPAGGPATPGRLATPIAPGPAAPASAPPGNPFQRTTPPRAATPATATPAARRRSSVGWLDPRLIAAMHAGPGLSPAPPPVASLSARPLGSAAGPGTGTGAGADARTGAGVDARLAVVLDPRAPPARMSRASPHRPKSDEVAGGPGWASDSGGDEVVASDGGGVSDSDSAFATTDDEGEGGGGARARGRFDGMKVPEIKQWLAQNKVPFIARSKKAELVSLARAHVNYLDTLAPDPPKPPPPPPPPPHTPPADHRREPSAPASASASAAVALPLRDGPPPAFAVGADADGGAGGGDDDDDDNVGGRPPSSAYEPVAPAGPPAPGGRGRARRRVTAAPATLDEGIVEDPPIDVDALPGRQSPAPRAEAAPRAAGRYGRGRAAAAPRAAAAQRAEPTPKRRQRMRVHMPPLPKVSPLYCVRAVFAFVAFALWAVLAVTLYNAYLLSLRPFCEADAVKFVLEDGRECRPCPANGECVNGELTCDLGYRRVDSRCAEDQEVSLYADHLASRAAGILADRAGRVQCGESVEKVLSSTDLRSLLEPETVEDGDGQRQPHRRRSGRFDGTKFSAAFAKALGLLDAPAAFGIRREFGGYAAVQPRLPTSCVARRFLLRNWRLFTSIAAGLVASVYVSTRRRRWAARQLAVLAACTQARLALEDQLFAFREGAADEDYITDTHLRDEVLGAGPAAVQLWKVVEVELRRDTRVSVTGPETHKGHPCYKWRWCGRATLLGSNSRRGSYGSGAPGSGARSGGRPSFGSYGSAGYSGRSSPADVGGGSGLRGGESGHRPGRSPSYGQR